MHGGISQHVGSIKDLRKLKRGWKDPSDPLVTDLLWADPDPNIKGFMPSPRGCSFLFGNDALLKFCLQLDIDMIVRGHEVVQDGYSINPTQRLITIFSAPNYCGQVSEKITL